jgi:hypothetical protein
VTIATPVGSCPLLAPNGHAEVVAACPLLRDERTWLDRGSKSENDPQRKSALVQQQPDML